MAPRATAVALLDQRIVPCDPRVAGGTRMLAGTRVSAENRTGFPETVQESTDNALGRPNLDKKRTAPGRDLALLDSRFSS